MEYEHILTSAENRVGIVQINRPKAMNALNSPVMHEICTAFAEFDADDNIGCILITGNQRAFAAGADIKEMAGATVVQMMNSPFINYWDKIALINKPIVAAVSGYALGGGCELAMACDMIVASESAQFGQPEINLGVIPGAGGTQRLTRAIGKALAMEMCIGGRFLTAQEALQFGLINRVFPTESYLQESVRFSAEIATRAPVATRLAKAAINAAFETTLTEGVARERNLFYTLFATDDQSEGMDAFINKRRPNWQGR